MIACDAGLRMAKLRRLSELCSGDLSETVLAHGVALHRTVLSLPASSVGLAQGQPAMGRRLVVVGLQRPAELLLVAVG